MGQFASMLGQPPSPQGGQRGFLPTNQRQQQPPPGSMSANRSGSSLPLDLQMQRIQQQLSNTMGQSTPTGYGALAKIISSAVLRKRQGKLAEQLQQQEAKKKQERTENYFWLCRCRKQTGIYTEYIIRIWW